MARKADPHTRQPTQSQIDGVRPITPFHWLVVGISLIATLTAWQMSLAGLKDRTRLQFDRQADFAIHLFEEQMRRYADVLLSGVGFIASSNHPDSEDWSRFTTPIELKQRHPAISGLGVASWLEPDELDRFTQEQRLIYPDFEIKPALDPQAVVSEPYYLPITRIAPAELKNKIIGLDVAREIRRSDAIERAMETGDVQITAPIRLGGSDNPGFLLIAPIYTSDVTDSTRLQRENFSGVIVASVITEKLVQNTLTDEYRQVALRVSDGGEVMYNEQIPDNANIDPEPLATRSQVVPFFGRNWQFDVQSTLAFHEAQHSLEPALILFGGLTINALLLYLLMQMAKANRRAIIFGKTIAGKYDRQSEVLQQTNSILEKRNEELQSFSYVVSHDLKSPLKGIEMLAECLEEDLVEQLQDLDLRADFVSNLRLIQKQVKLSQGLIKGVLEYSGLSSDAEVPETVDVRELLHSIRVMLAVDEDQFQLSGEFPILETYQTQLFQVFMNLISNGYKYHEGDGTAVVTITVSASPQPGFHRFQVSDNGPGIDPRYHQKIFDVFSTLQPKDHSMSSGVGLAIVKKLVCRHNGDVQVESEPGQGSRFQFDWPCQAEHSESGNSDYLPKAA